MIQHVWTVFCTKAVVDRASNNVSLLDVIEQVELSIEGEHPPAFPIALAFEASLVSLLTRTNAAEPTRGYMRVRLLGPQGESLFVTESPIDLETAPRQRQIGRITGLRVAGPGWHQWEIACRGDPNAEWQVKARVPMEITVTQSTPAAASASRAQA